MADIWNIISSNYTTVGTTNLSKTPYVNVDPEVYTGTWNGTYSTNKKFSLSISDVSGFRAKVKYQSEGTVKYQDETWALLEFANIRVAFVLPEQHPPHFAVLGDPAAYGQPKTHRDGTRSVYLQDPSGNNVEILALK